MTMTICSPDWCCQRLLIISSMAHFSIVKGISQSLANHQDAEEIVDSGKKSAQMHQCVDVDDDTTDVDDDEDHEDDEYDDDDHDDVADADDLIMA